MVTNVVMVIGLLLVAVGIYALFKLQTKENDTSINVGPVKISTKSPALAVIVLGLLCISGRFVAPSQQLVLPDGVVASYLAQVKAYNSRDAAAYYGSFTDPMQCFYSVPNARMSEKRPDLTSHLEVNPTDIVALDVQASRVELCDRGHWVNPSGVNKQHHKIIVMEKRGPDWLVTIETEGDSLNCYSSANVSKC